MPDYNAIADVSLTLREALRTGLAGIVPPSNVDLEDFRQPIGENDLRVTIFLFEIAEDPSTRNRPRLRQPVDDHTVRMEKPKLTLLLRYLITPWSPNRRTVQIILGRIVQLFYDHPIIAGSDLSGATLPGTTEALKVTLALLSLEDRTRIWHAVQQPYRVSVTYEVRVVNIDAQPGEPVPTVGRREIQYGGVETGA